MILIIIIIVIIICYLLLVSRNKMWDNLPVSNKKMKNEGYITNNFNVQIDSSKYNIYVFSPNQSINHLISFINENSNLLTNINNDVDIELFRYETINSDSFINNYLSLYHKKKIIGTLVNTPYDLFFYNTIVNTNKIKFLVIHNDYNYNNIYSILFNYNIQKNIYGKYKTFLMEKDKMKYPFNYICKSRYYTYDLYNISKNSNYTNIRMYKQDNNLNKYFDFYNRKIKAYKVYRIFNREDFNRYFETIVPFVYCFYEEKNNQVVSMCVIKRNKSEGIINIVLSDDNVVDFISNVLFVCKNLGMITMKCLNIMNNILFLDQLHFKKSYHKYYHLFNYHLNFKIDPCDFAIV